MVFSLYQNQELFQSLITKIQLYAQNTQARSNLALIDQISQKSSSKSPKKKEGKHIRSRSRSLSEWLHEEATVKMSQEMYGAHDIPGDRCPIVVYHAIPPNRECRDGRKIVSTELYVS